MYVWADGVYSNVRMDDRLCLLVIVGSDDTGRKEVLAVVDGYRESEASWLEVIEQLESQGLTIPPKLAIDDFGDGLEADIGAAYLNKPGSIQTAHPFA